MIASSKLRRICKIIDAAAPREMSAFRSIRKAHYISALMLRICSI